MPPRTPQRRYLVRGRLRVPFERYRGAQRPSTGERASAEDDAAFCVGTFGAHHGLTPEQALVAQQQLTRAERRRGRLTGPWLAARIAGIISAVKGGRVGNRAFGWSMHGRVGGRVMAVHGAHILRENQPKAVRAATIARRQRVVAAAFRPSPASPSRTSYLAL